MTYMTNLERIWYEGGLEEGREEGREELALNMLRKKYSLEAIAEVTSLSIETLQQLQNKLNNQD